MKSAAKWGAILGVTVCVWTLGLHFAGLYTTNIGAGQIADIVAIIFPIGAIVLALRERKARGPMSFGQALGTAMIVGVVSIPITAGFLWWYHHFMNPKWVDYIIEYQRAKLTAAGTSAELIAAMETAQRSSSTDGAQLTGAVVGTSIFSLIIGLVAGAIMRTRSKA